MKITFICGYDWSLIQFRLDLIKCFLNKGWKVSALYPASEEKPTKILEELGVETQTLTGDRLNLNPFHLVKQFYQLLRSKSLHNSEVIFVYHMKYIFLYSFISIFIRSKTSVCLLAGLGNFFDFSDNSNHFRQRCKLFLFRLALNAYNAVICQNESIPKFIDKFNLLSSRTKITIVNGSGVNTEILTPVTRNCRKIRFLSIGRPIKEKGFIELINVFKQLEDKDLELTIVLGNNVKNIKDVEQTIRMTASLDKRIEVKSFNAEISTYYKTHDVFVLNTYYNEGLPKTLLEAMSCGLPLITTNRPGCCLTVSEPQNNGVNDSFMIGENGLLTNGKPSSLKASLEYMVKNKHLLVKMGKLSRQLAMKNFDSKLINSKMIQAIEACVFKK